MSSFLNWLLLERIKENQLSDESKTKVCLITDLCKCKKLIINEPLDTEEFNKLYDMSIEELNRLLAVQQAYIYTYYSKEI